MQRIFISSNQLNTNIISLDTETFHHLFNVCRLTLNSSLEVVIDHTRLLQISIESYSNDQITFKIKDQWSIEPIRKTSISLIQSLPKQDKLTDICRMCTELGVNAIYPVISDFCDVSTLTDHKFNRAKKAIETAAKQSKQHHITKLNQSQSLDDCLKQLSLSNHSLKLIAYENSTSQLNQLITSLPTEIIVAIGPEGGFSQNDISIFKAFDFIPFSLGDHILRTEHAGFASICYIDGFFDSL